MASAAKTTIEIEWLRRLRWRWAVVERNVPKPGRYEVHWAFESAHGTAMTKRGALKKANRALAAKAKRDARIMAIQVKP